MGSPDGQAIGSILKGAAKQAAAACRRRGRRSVRRTARGAHQQRPRLAGRRRGRDAKLEAEGWNQEGWNQEAWNQEGWNQEDREFEGAKQFVRVAADTVRNAMAAAGSTDPMSAAQDAIAQAAELRAPGLMQTGPRYGMAPYSGRYPGAYAGDDSGRWMRRGNRIVLFGV